MKLVARDFVGTKTAGDPLAGALFDSVESSILLQIRVFT